MGVEIVFYYLVVQWVAFIVLAYNILQPDGYLTKNYALRDSILFNGFWISVLSLILFLVWRNKKTVYQLLYPAMPSIFFSFILGAIILIFPPELGFFLLIGLSFWMIFMRNTERIDKKKTAFILVNASCFSLIISGIQIYYVSHIVTYFLTFFVLVFFLFSIYKMFPNNTLAKYNISAIFLSFLVHLLPFTYDYIFEQLLRIDPVDTMDAFSLFLIIPTLILTYGYFRKSSVLDPVILKKRDLVSIWMITFGIPIIGFIFFIVMQGLAGLGS